MKCPKCQYIAFEAGRRCRNCGYEFALAVEDPPLDVSFDRDLPEPGMAPDLSLRDADPPPPSEADRTAPELSRREGAASRVQRAFAAEDLPLFIEGVADDQAPLVTPPAVPRPPLSVRRAHPSSRPRPRPSVEEPSLDLSARSEDQEERARAAAAAEAAQRAAIARRAGAGLIDVAVLGTIGTAVVVLTLRLTGLTLEQWQTLPLVPLAAFLLLLCGGYFVLFTVAGGQTIGKMVTGIRVVPDARGAADRVRVPFGTAMLRAVACLGSVAAAGAGFLPVLFSSDRRAFHDRVADTRVVSA